jgi:hypothetical protein
MPVGPGTARKRKSPIRQAAELALALLEAMGEARALRLPFAGYDEAIAKLRKELRS